MESYSEYHACISLAMSLGKTFDEAKSDWNNLNNRLQPDYSFNRPNANKKMREIYAKKENS